MLLLNSISSAIHSDLSKIYLLIPLKAVFVFATHSAGFILFDIIGISDFSILPISLMTETCVRLSDFKSLKYSLIKISMLSNSALGVGISPALELKKVREEISYWRLATSS